MAEYIEREAIMKFPIRKGRCDKEHANEHFIFGIESVMEYVENLPAADVAPVVHGRWIVEIDALGREYTVCPVCNSNFRMKQDGGRWLRIDLRGFEYCPHCGAKMDGGADDAAG